MPYIGTASPWCVIARGVEDALAVQNLESSGRIDTS